ncbi:hypothetical protein [Paenibacillus wenxiniae]|uniref:DUF4352 domain-containing protein n=1 Tax=Paenibacillus wenxiniae TaxID=1636843 RepID=A0ABW4RQT2_9BACL
MNRLTRWVWGVSLASTIVLVTACSSGKSEAPAPSAQQPATEGSSSEATGAGGTGTTNPESSEGSMDTGSGETNQGSTDSNTGNGSHTAPAQSSDSSGSTGSNAGSETSNNADPELTPQTTELKISSVQQGPGQLFLRVDEMPKGYGVSKMEWESPGYNETATFDQAVQNGKNGKDGFFASGDQRNFGFIYSGSHSGQTGKVTLTLRNSSGDELTWYDHVTLQ